jgi:hypothetical protein
LHDLGDDEVAALHLDDIHAALHGAGVNYRAGIGDVRRLTCADVLPEGPRAVSPWNWTRSLAAIVPGAKNFLLQSLKHLYRRLAGAIGRWTRIRRSAALDITAAAFVDVTNKAMLLVHTGARARTKFRWQRILPALVERNLPTVSVCAAAVLVVIALATVATRQYPIPPTIHADLAASQRDKEAVEARLKAAAQLPQQKPEQAQLKAAEASALGRQSLLSGQFPGENWSPTERRNVRFVFRLLRLTDAPVTDDPLVQSDRAAIVQLQEMVLAHPLGGAAGNDLRDIRAFGFRLTSLLTRDPGSPRGVSPIATKPPDQRVRGWKLKGAKICKRRSTGLD